MFVVSWRIEHFKDIIFAHDKQKFIRLRRIYVLNMRMYKSMSMLICAYYVSVEHERVYYRYKKYG